MAIEALYVHVPYCQAKCRYCDFDSVACRSKEELDAYTAGMSACVEAFARRGDLVACRTVYLGGGTPTLLGERLPGLVEKIRDAAPSLRELTCEANPESLTRELAYALSDAGATRISLGVQTFDDTELSELGRIHTSARAHAAIEAARDAGLDVSIDLMCGIPLQTTESWRATLDEAVSSGVGHISVYPLTVEEGTPFDRMCASGELDEPDEDFQAWCMDEARRDLVSAGYHPYEVASYARPGKECRHNVAYWTGVSYLGLGRSAASMLDRETYDGLRDLLGLDKVPGEVRRVRISQKTDALPFGQGAGPAYDCELLTEREAAAEDLMLGMRMTRGVPADLIDRARAVVGADDVDAALARAVSEGLARWVEQDARFCPTERGWLMGNELFGIMWDLACS